MGDKGKKDKGGREAKKEKFYVGNGEVVWTDGKIVKGGKEQNQSPKSQPSQEQSQGYDDLPF